MNSKFDELIDSESNIRIVKNSLYLYVRMFLTMGVSLYTSRIVLNTLGIHDYGVYSIVGGVVSLFGFFNSTMSSATQRFLSFEIGGGNLESLKKVFNTALVIHIAIAFVVLILAETIGLWFVLFKLNVPSNRMEVVHWVYQFSILTFLLGIIQVPYNALIVARERMSIFAYISIIEVLLKLLILYVLVIFDVDKLKLYAILIFLVSLIIRVIYQIYCKMKFAESKYKFYVEKKLYIEMISFTGWSLFGNIAAIARGQGGNVLLNLFFGTLMNAAYGITLQVQGAVQAFVTNFQMAVNPQIIKQYSAGHKEKSLQLIFQSSKFSFLLMFLITSPIIFNIDYILELWLKDPPGYTSVFIVLSLVNLLIDTISGPLQIGAQASGNIKWYQITIGTLIFLSLPISYFMLKLYKIPELIFIVFITINILSLFFRLNFLKKMIGLNIKSFLKNVLSKILMTSFIVIITFYLFTHFISLQNTLSGFLLKSISITIINVIIMLTIGLKKDERKFIFSFINKRI